MFPKLPTKIAIISDTHCSTWEEVHPDIRKAVEVSDIAVHCGDIVRMPVVEGFLRSATIGYIVHGNSDPVDLRSQLPYKEVFEVEGVTIGAIHPAWGGPEFPPEELFNDFPEKPDVILFGHTHEPMNKSIKGVLFVNPGQGYKSFMEDCTMALLEVDKGKIEVNIVTVVKGRPS